MSNPPYERPPSPPPPSYEISQHEFDRKISQVVEQSASDPPRRRVDDEGFEVWDDAIFQAALASMSDLSLGQASQARTGKAPQIDAPFNHAGSASSASSPPSFSPNPNYSAGYPPEKVSARRSVPEPSGGGASGSSSVADTSSVASSPPSSPPQPTRPLRVSKKTRPTKERPAWYAEAGLGGGSPPPSPLTSPGSSSSSGREQMPLRRQLTVFNNTERERTPPPEFTPVGPSLDGPPGASAACTRRARPSSLLHTPPPADFATPQPQATTAVRRPNSARPHPPPHAHAQSHPQLRHSPAPTLRPPVHHQSLPAANSTSAATALRASAFEPMGKHNSAPRLSFNPQMAYKKPTSSPMSMRTVDTEPQPDNATAFYSNAVSAQYSFNVPAHMRRASQLPQPVQQQYPQHQIGMTAPSNATASMISLQSSPPPVASPRPSYAYGQATFQEPTSQPGGPWGNTQQSWSGGRSSIYQG
ncbi:hypothetical protein C8Q80DRAFT_1154351 [Daedaleopsis nitida]|nr:hypothetical protein C8Q80DRAFT_1154351 [Daedaleopsis nitida]